MQDYDASAAKAYFGRLFAEGAVQSLAEIAEVARRNHAGPARVPSLLQQAGLGLPKGVTASTSEEEVDDPRDVPVEFRPQLPGPAIRKKCIRICTPLISDRIFVTRCVEFCFWG
jgi:hypothetical protein